MMEIRTDAQTYSLIYRATRAGVVSQGLPAGKILTLLLDAEVDADPREREWFEDVEWLFDSLGPGGVLTMHEYTKRALLQVYDEMIASKS